MNKKIIKKNIVNMSELRQRKPLPKQKQQLPIKQIPTKNEITSNIELFIFYFLALIPVRILSALYIGIQDCDGIKILKTIIIENNTIKKILFL
jgi:hypothetical protein